MHEQISRVLILDHDPEMLISLQQLLEDAGVDVTITWDQAEARQLVESKCFDLILVGDHPPELDAASILRVVSSQAGSYPSLVLRGIANEEDLEHFRGLGTIGVIPRRDPTVILEQVRRALSSKEPGPHRLPQPAQGRSWRAAC